MTYLLPNGAPVVKTYAVPAQSRFNIWVDQEGPALADAEVSAVVRSTNGVPIILERAMYLTTPAQGFAAGHESAGVTAPATSWFLAEGATGALFDLFILVANPNPQAATLEARYLLTSGQVITKRYTAAPNSRFNIWVDLEDARAGQRGAVHDGDLDQRRADHRGAGDVVAGADAGDVVRGAQLAGVHRDGREVGDGGGGTGRRVGDPDLHPHREHVGDAGDGAGDAALRGRHGAA